LTPDSPFVRNVAPSPNFGDRRGRSIDAIILHYTGMSTGSAALARLLDPTSEVSCHYLVWEDGAIDQLVRDADRAWHAGRSCWHGERDMNAVSLGIELVNTGHDGGCPPYPTAQITALIALTRELCRRHVIAPERVLAHSDIAPDRKIDPGEWFPWKRLADEGVGLWIAPAPLRDGSVLDLGDEGDAVAALQRKLATLGFDAPQTGRFCSDTQQIIAAFQRRRRPARVDGRADPSTRDTLETVLQARPTV
jgi:N-acetylmuramoyl-L-alanine amidase